MFSNRGYRGLSAKLRPFPAKREVKGRTFLGKVVGAGEFGRDGNKGERDLVKFSDKPHPCLSSSTGNSPSF